MAVSNKEKKEIALYSLINLIPRLIKDYGYDEIFWLRLISDSNFFKDLINPKTQYWGEGVVYHKYIFVREMVERKGFKMIEIFNIVFSENIVSATVRIIEEGYPEFEIAVNVITKEIVKNTLTHLNMYSSGAANKLLKLYEEHGVNLPKRSGCAWF